MSLQQEDAKSSESPNDSDKLSQFSKFLNEWKNKLHLFIESCDNSKIEPSDFEKNKSTNSENPNPFDNVENFEGEKSMYSKEGRKSFIRIKNKKNWPPTMEDLLEYISIYSQMNSIKFVTLNHDKYIQSKKKKTKRKSSSKDNRDSMGKSHKKWKSISKFDFTSSKNNPVLEEEVKQEEVLRTVSVVTKSF